MTMERRSFLRLLGGASGTLVASATMAEAGMLAEFLDWLKRAPAWSFPIKPILANEAVVDIYVDYLRSLTAQLNMCYANDLR